jgi:uncharacterized surface protein with fasciclin (FAS1) repeats
METTGDAMSHLLARRTFTIVALLAVVAAGCGDDGGTSATTAAPTTAVETTATGGDVLEVAGSEGDLATFLAATEAAEIMDGLHGTGPFTVFAPTDEAFTAYLDESGMSKTEVFADATKLRRLVQHHIVNMNEDAEMVMAMAGESLTTAAGTPLEITVEGDTVMVGDATVLRYDLQATNGVIHVIDAVLLPPAG